MSRLMRLFAALGILFCWLVVFMIVAVIRVGGLSHIDDPGHPAQSNWVGNHPIIGFWIVIFAMSSVAAFWFWPRRRPDA